jgi:hypothetical protein
MVIDPSMSAPHFVNLSASFPARAEWLARGVVGRCKETAFDTDQPSTYFRLTGPRLGVGPEPAFVRTRLRAGDAIAATRPARCRAVA